MKNSKILKLIPLLSLLLVSLPVNIFGIEFEKEDNVHISNIHVIEDDLLSMANRITIDGEIEGDLIGLALNVATNGTIKNSVTVIARDFIHTGTVEGGIKIISESARIDGMVGRSVLAISNQFHLGSNGHVGNDLICRGEVINIDGVVEGTADIHAKKVYITGTIEEDLNIEADVIQLIAPALIKGDFTYISDNQAKIDINSGVTIVGETKWNLPEPKDEDSDNKFTTIVHEISEILAAFLFGIILMAISRKYILESINQIQTKFGIATATGFLGVIIFVICLVILIISAILMLFGYILISNDNPVIGATILALSTLVLPIASFMTVSGGILLYSGKIIIGLILGFYLVRFVDPKTNLIGRFKLLVGLIVIFILFYIPYVGYVARFLVATIGLGAIIQGIKNCRYEKPTAP